MDSLPSRDAATPLFCGADFFVHACSFLDQKDATNLEYKLDSFSSVYQKLTGKVRTVR